MLDCAIIGGLPPTIRLSRNDRPLEGMRVEIGRLRVEDGDIWVADNAWIDQLPPLPIRAPRGEYPVHVYQWVHRTGPVNLCVAIGFGKQLAAITRRLEIHTEVWPDLTQGVIVDTAEIAVRSSNSLSLSSGLGDGEYPVFANYNPGLVLQSIVVDFKVWEVDRHDLESGRAMDDYGIPNEIAGDDQRLAGNEEGKAVREEYRRHRVERVAREIASGARFVGGPPCPSCGRPLRTSRSGQCFLCGYKAG